MKIYSKVQANKIILSFLNFREIDKKRHDISPDNEYLQTSGRVLKKNFFVKAHKHNKLLRKTEITQEAWIILKGRIFARFYDLDDSIIYEDTFGPGDCVTIFRGGHELKVLEDDTYFYEIKNGPYYGIEKDKQEIK
jgi:hypothetical protein